MQGKDTGEGNAGLTKAKWKMPSGGTGRRWEERDAGVRTQKAVGQ